MGLIGYARFPTVSDHSGENQVIKWGKISRQVAITPRPYSMRVSAPGKVYI